MTGKNILFKMVNLYPPFLGAGIRVKVSKDIKTIDVTLKLSFYNRNYVGTQYGGSMYSMCDPFYMILLMENLGKDYIVWDQSASITFKKPGKTRLRATFHIPESQYQAIKSQLEVKEKIYPVFTVDILDNDDNIVATVDKTIYIKKK
ncbi:MAG TPA: DUF4442 domain-containing protein [Spirochaetota bacterium]|nr:DUF4442 domain-containing protein [Spirochaetota bacterium]